MKREIDKKNYTVSEITTEFEKNPCYRTLEAVTGLLGEPKISIENFPDSSSGGLSLMSGIKEVHTFIEDCLMWSYKLKAFVENTVEKGAFSENPFFEVLFIVILPEVIELLKSVDQLMFFPCKSEDKLLPFLMTIEKLNDFFKECVALEAKLEGFVEKFKKEELKKQLFGNGIP